MLSLAMQVARMEAEDLRALLVQATVAAPMSTTSLSGDNMLNRLIMLLFCLMTE